MKPYFYIYTTIFCPLILQPNTIPSIFQSLGFYSCCRNFLVADAKSSLVGRVGLVVRTSCISGASSASLWPISESQFAKERERGKVSFKFIHSQAVCLRIAYGASNGCYSLNKLDTSTNGIYGIQKPSGP